MTNGIRRLRCFLAPGFFSDPGSAIEHRGPCFLCQVWLTPMPDETMPTVVACVSFGCN